MYGQYEICRHWGAPPPFMVARETESRDGGGSRIEAGGEAERLDEGRGDSKTRREEVSELVPTGLRGGSGTRRRGRALRRGVVGSEEVGEGRDMFGWPWGVGSARKSGERARIGGVEVLTKRPDLGELGEVMLMSGGVL